MKDIAMKSEKISLVKERIKQNRNLLRLIRVCRWSVSKLFRPMLGFYTLLYLFRLKKCGVPVEFTTTMIINNPRNIEIGTGCTFSNLVILDGHDRITIGDNCMFANRVTIATATHDYTVDPMNSRIITKSVTIKNNVWMGVGATILPGVTIGEGAVIGSMSLVTKDVPARAIVMGVPARVIKFREPSY
jgi:maltose O-acetyltransferase